MSRAEWESLCDGCGRCCLHKLCNDETGELSYTNVACHLLDVDTCQCRHYADRGAHVPDCVALKPAAVGKLFWLPRTCAYRLVHEGKDLPDWHPLVSGDPETVHAAGMSVRGKVVSEETGTDDQDWDKILAHHIVDWWD